MIFSKKMTNICKCSKAVLQTPIGLICVTACNVGVHSIKLTAATELPTGHDDRVTTSITEAPDHWPAALRECTDWLAMYFKNAEAAYQRPLPLFHRPDAKPETFTYRVWETLTSQVPCGQTVSYAQLAAMAGNNKACRAVGGAMRANQIAILMPCHRVTASGGGLGNYMSGNGNALKKWLLDHEGVTFK
ncbi:methylated-DNA--protein-cysteine methyltransferase-like isoform X2 [Asterias rubens]|uniref:methylated-DNA--protein-cysteine methyltransferase-like isoform X2 n=1 Tax=Asterias rubens TaxID=7604 RepID=UPI0014553A9B|nr:methylated-DNA--protein-cysteine methyltransferase-like isoform X2 [Asterias rubens]